MHAYLYMYTCMPHKYLLTCSYTFTHILTLPLECKVTYSSLVLTGQMPSAAFVLGDRTPGEPSRGLRHWPQVIYNSSASDSLAQVWVDFTGLGSQQKPRGNRGPPFTASSCSLWGFSHQGTVPMTVFTLSGCLCLQKSWTNLGSCGAEGTEGKTGC